MHIGALAHAGEELLFVLVPVAAFLTVYVIRTRRAARGDGDPPAEE